MVVVGQRKQFVAVQDCAPPKAEQPDQACVQASYKIWLWKTLAEEPHKATDGHIEGLQREREVISNVVESSFLLRNGVLPE